MSGQEQEPKRSRAQEQEQEQDEYILECVNDTVEAMRLQVLELKTEEEQKEKVKEFLKRELDEAEKWSESLPPILYKPDTGISAIRKVIDFHLKQMVRDIGDRLDALNDVDDDELNFHGSVPKHLQRLNLVKRVASVNVHFGNVYEL